MNLSHLDDSDQETIRKELDAQTARIAELEKALEDAAAEEDVDTDLPEDDLTEPVRKALAARDEDIAKANERAERAEATSDRLREERDTERYAADAEKYQNILGADAAPMLKGLGTAAPDDYATLTEALDKLTAIEDVSELFKVFGDDAAADGSAVDRIAAIAKEIQKEERDEFATLQVAKAEAWRRNPDLVTQAREERG
jgi:hypothetical protein